MKRQLSISLALHAAALAAILITIPHIAEEVDLSQQIIPVDIVNVSDVTNTKVSKEPTPKPTPAPTKTETPTPQQQTPTPPPPEPPKPAPPAPPTPPPPDPQAETIPDKTKPVEKPKDQPKPTPPTPDKVTPPKDPTPPKNALANILKNVEKMKETTRPSPTPHPDAPDEDKPVTSNEAPSLGAQLSISEIDALRRQISQCWNVPSGARGIENMDVEIYIEVGDDKIPTRVEVVDKARLVSDPYFRTLAESAVRAVRNPRCTPLQLPEGKSGQWNKIRMTFNPKDML